VAATITPFMRTREKSTASDATEASERPLAQRLPLLVPNIIRHHDPATARRAPPILPDQETDRLAEERSTSVSGAQYAS